MFLYLVFAVFFMKNSVLAKSILDSHTWKKVGVLSQGNFDTIHHIASNAQPVLANGNAHLYELVLNGDVDVGLISGKVQDPDDIFYTFPSGAISPRAIMTRKGDEKTRKLMDAAIVRLQRSGLISEYAQENAPFEYVEVHMCRSDDPDKHLPFQFYNITNQTVIRVGALGPYNWHQDGDYTQNPPTGFWPSFYKGIDDILVNHTLIRQWYPTSKAVMDALLAGEIDATEGYWTVDSFYEGNPRTWFFDPGCTTLGYESTFFMLKENESDPTKNTSILTIWLSVCSALIALGAVFVIFMIRREKKGQPLFGTLLLNAENTQCQVQSV